LPRRPADLLAGSPASLVAAAITGVVAAILAWSVPPFRAGDAFSSAGLGGMAWWLVAGTAAGLLADRGMSALRKGPARRAMAADPDRGRHLAIGIAVGAALAVVLGRAGSGALALAGLLSLTAVLSSAATATVIGAAHRVRPGAMVTPPAVTATTTGLVLGSILGAIVGRGPSAVILVVAAVVVVTVVLLRRSSAGPASSGPPTAPPPSAAALVLMVVATAGALAFALAAAAPTAARAASGSRSKTVKVSANKGWVSSGLTLAAGEQLKITASGSVRFIAKDKAAAADPDGLPAHYQGCGGPGFCGVLVGRVAAGTPFLIGSTYTGPATAAGALELSVNDYNPADNSGSFSAHVTVAPAGTFTGTGVAPTQPIPGAVTGSSSSAPSKGGPAVFAALLAAFGALVGSSVGRRAAALPAGPAIYLVGSPAWEEPHGRSRRTAAAAEGYAIVEGDGDNTGDVTVVESHEGKSRSYRIANAAPLSPESPQIALAVAHDAATRPTPAPAETT
jgi:hypothetical protein